MFKFFLSLMLITSCFFLAGLLGVRVHPENVFARVDPGRYEQYREFEFSKGNTMIGRLISEDEETIRIQAGAGTVTLQKGDIASMREIQPQEIASGRYDLRIPETRARSDPWITQRYEDSIFYHILEQFRVVLSETSSDFSTEVVSGLQAMNPLQGMTSGMEQQIGEQNAKMDQIMGLLQGQSDGESSGLAALLGGGSGQDGGLGGIQDLLSNPNVSELLEQFQGGSGSSGKSNR